MKYSIALYPGTFDPITLAHLDIINRAQELFDFVYIGIAKNISKKNLFSEEERLKLIEENISDNPKLKAVIFDKLTVEFAKTIQAKTIIRGLRATSDFDYEFQMAQINRHLEPNIETIFLMPKADFFYTSSSLIKQLSHFSTEKIQKFVPKNVICFLNAKQNLK